MSTILDDWLLEQLGNEAFNVKGLDFKEFSQKLAPIVQKFKKLGTKVIIIGGTNGKGETCHKLSYLLCQDHQSVAMWTSPHILSVTERYLFNNKCIEKRELIALFNQNEKLCSIFSYYEFLFYTFCEWAIERRPDVLLLEVGLGGRLDGVNVFDADFCAITSISRDHMEILGPSLKDVLKEKFGITREGRKCFSSILNNELRVALSEYCDEKRVSLVDLIADQTIYASQNFKERNSLLAIEMYKHIGKKNIQEDLITFPSIMGRGEKVTSPLGRFIFIGSHNEDGLREMFHWLKDSSFDQIIVGLSKRPDNDLRECVEILLEKWPKVSKGISFVHFNHFKAAESYQLETMIKGEIPRSGSEESIHYFLSVERCLEKIKSDSEQSFLVCGSYYFLGQFISLLSSYNDS